MPAYRYEAVDARGKSQRGVVEADTARAARQKVRALGLMPVAVDLAAADGTGSRWRRGISTRELALLTRQFATLLEAGLAMEQCLNALIEQTESDKIRAVLVVLRTEIRSGYSLARAMGRFPRVFPEIDRTLVAAGEESGRLAEVMSRLADHTESRDALRQKLVQAAVYPAVLSVVAVGVVASLMILVVPKVVHVFARAHQALPLITRLLILTSDWMRMTWHVTLLAIIGLTYLFLRRLQRDTDFRTRVHQRFMRLPVLGALAIGFDSARLSATLSILVGSGVPLLKAIEAGAGVVHLMPLKSVMEDVRQRVSEGQSFARALGHSKQFPPLLVHLIASGEQSGRLDIMLERAARQQSMDLSHRLTTLTSLLEPVLVLLMGAVVLTIVIGIMQPLLTMNTLVTR